MVLGKPHGESGVPTWVAASMGMVRGAVGNFWRDRDTCIGRDTKRVSVVLPTVPINFRREEQDGILDGILGITVAGVSSVASMGKGKGTSYIFRPRILKRSGFLISRSLVPYRIRR